MNLFISIVFANTMLIKYGQAPKESIQKNVTQLLKKIIVWCVRLFQEMKAYMEKGHVHKTAFD